MCNKDKDINILEKKVQEQQIAWWVLCHHKRKDESPNCVAARFGDSSFVQMDLPFPFAYWHHIICIIQIQDTFSFIWNPQATPHAPWSTVLLVFHQHPAQPPERIFINAEGKDVDVGGTCKGCDIKCIYIGFKTRLQINIFEQVWFLW